MVQRRDTLSGIAKKFGTSLAALEAANRADSHHAG
ncbi:MAG: LysM peptidoglycan-binding domain-containing protein [Mycolicibacterium sp.]|nr:LysM peptidoglycan-binding domain-containing protein [Mycolicibacterium sp.]